MRNWWDAPEYDERRPMDFGKAPKLGPFRRVALTTDPKLEKDEKGQARLRLVNRHPHEALRVYCGSSQRARC